MSAHVRCGIRPDWTDRVRRRRVNTRRMQHILQRIRASRERRSRQLHGVSAERYDVPTHVRRALHGVGRHEVRGRDVHPRAVPRTVRHGHLVLFLQQAEGVQRAGDVRAPGLPDAAAGAAAATLPLSAVGGTISYADGYKIHMFTTTGPNMFTVTSGGTIEYLVVAGGGGGGAAHTTAAGENPGAGGGGAGGIITGTLTVDVQQYTITVGAGVAGVAGSTNTANGNNGEDSSISSLVVAKGGGGGGKGTDGVAGLSGGCGGGAGGSSTGANSGSGGSGSIGFDGGDSLGLSSGGGGALGF